MVIHGECYSENVVRRGEMIYLIDRESGTIAAGEIDLVTVTEGWAKELV